MQNTGLDEAQAGIMIAGRNISNFRYLRTSLVAQMVKHLPTMWETQVQSRGPEDRLEKEMVLLPGKPHGGRSLAHHSPWGHKESDTTERLNFRYAGDTTLMAESEELKEPLDASERGE